MRKTLFSLVLALLVVGASGLFIYQFSQAQDNGNFTWAGTTPMPDFPANVEWINVEEPLTPEDLQGKIVMLDFWTYGCINCIHVIPDLHRLEEEFSDDLIVIGVHSAKFENEGNTDNIQQIVRRYDVTHPVINDNNFEIWRTYGVQAWPTMVLIDPLGNIVGGQAGEGVYEIFQPVLETMVEEYSAAGLLSGEPVAGLLPEIDAETALSYPGKVLADEAGNRLFVADSDHNRIVVMDLDNPANVTIIGSGERGFDNGTYAAATFSDPQGMAIDGDTLYVADTSNHAIRRIDLANQQVFTLVGTGEQASTYPPVSGLAPDVELSSPWDLTLYDNILYIAMAGPHQLWRVELESGLTIAHAGSGRENIIDAPLAEAQLAQPSGIATDGELLYFADAEVSAIRTATIALDGTVQTIVGTGLFDFGDVDGVGDDVLLQHALGVTVAPDGYLYIADTYNNKIKRIDPATRESVTFAGVGIPGLADGALNQAQFYEPGGIDYANGKLYIADTNNHAIRVIDLETETVSTIALNESILLPEGDSDTDGTETSDIPGQPVVRLDAITLAPGASDILIDIEVPDGYKLNGLAPFTVSNQSDDVVSFPDESINFRQIEPELPLSLSVNLFEGETLFVSNVTVYWCEAINEELCFIERIRFEVPVTVSAEAEAGEIMLPYTLVPPDFSSDFGN